MSKFDGLDATAKAVHAGETVQITGRELLGWFNASRRGSQVVERVREELTRRKLTTDPDFNEVWLDVPIVVKSLAPKAKKQEQAAGKEQAPPPSSLPSAGDGDDPVLRIGRLPAANQGLVSVRPGSSLKEATTIMLMRDFSQLPVLHSEKTCRGAVSWQSIATATTLKGPRTSVDECMAPVEEVRLSTPLLDAIPKIVAAGFVIVRDHHEKVQGIVTVTDLSLQFRALSEPFLLIGQIENLLRRLVRKAFSLEELQAAKNPGDGRTVDDVSDLSFGEHVRLLQPSNAWAKLGLAIERAPFIERLDEVRLLRNEIMHFDPDPLDAGQLEMLRTFALFLERIT